MADYIGSVAVTKRPEKQPYHTEYKVKDATKPVSRKSTNQGTKEINGPTIAESMSENLQKKYQFDKK